MLRFLPRAKVCFERSLEVDVSLLWSNLSESVPRRPCRSSAAILTPVQSIPLSGAAGKTLTHFTHFTHFTRQPGPELGQVLYRRFAFNLSETSRRGREQLRTLSSGERTFFEQFRILSSGERTFTSEWRPLSSGWRTILGDLLMVENPP